MIVPMANKVMVAMANKVMVAMANKVMMPMVAASPTRLKLVVYALTVELLPHMSALPWLWSSYLTCLHCPGCGAATSHVCIALAVELLPHMSALP